MKINQAPAAFAPITIVLESYAEAMALLDACLGSVPSSMQHRQEIVNEIAAFLGTEAKL